MACRSIKTSNSLHFGRDHHIGSGSYLFIEYIVSRGRAFMIAKKYN
jgi:hypothetical protein